HGAALPVSVAMYRMREMAAALRTAVEHAKPYLVHVQLVRMAPYIEDLRGCPAVLDLLDASDLNMRERARAAAPGARQVSRGEAGRDDGRGDVQNHAGNPGWPAQVDPPR